MHAAVQNLAFYWKTMAFEGKSNKMCNDSASMFQLLADNRIQLKSLYKGGHVFESWRCDKSP